MTAPTQPSPEAVGLVAAALRAEGVLSIAVWQGIDYTVEQRNSDAAGEALFAYVASLEADGALLDAVDSGEFNIWPHEVDLNGEISETRWTVEFCDGRVTHPSLRSAIGWAIAATQKKVAA